MHVTGIAAKTLEKLSSNNPSFHELNGETANWAARPDTLHFLTDILRPGMFTFETGAGQTTVVFAISVARDTCITPNAAEVDRIRQYCNQEHISHDVDFGIGCSDVILPHEDGMPERLDHLFIDGKHVFPATLVDWYYAGLRLAIGGTVGIDDYCMPSVRVPHDFLDGDDEWELIAVSQYTSFFGKLAEPRYWWSGQRINADYPGYYSSSKKCSQPVPRNAARSSS